MNYHAKVLGTAGDGWGKCLVGVFLGDEEIGEYMRNYPGTPPFFPFERDGRWYALYSRHYTATRLMSLPDCRDLGGEEPDSFGFCPVEYHVPLLRAYESDPADPKPLVGNHDAERWARKAPSECGQYTRYYWPDEPNGHTHLKEAYLAEKERSHEAADEWRQRHPFVERHARWGLVSGCVWGDDSSWKVEFVDLERAPEGVLVRDNRFGSGLKYGQLELPRGVSLKDAVDTEWVDDLNAPPSEWRIRFAIPTTFDLAGKRID